jgi:SAM-dependent methyltransferase|tara:strand:- start:63 stop:731 length:669 start_codon:yes stop_codon:yes gene_type:complete
MGNLDKIFKSIYVEKKWGYKDNDVFYSGMGSHYKDLVNPYINSIKNFTENFKEKLNVIDIGCGDFNVGKQLLPYFNNYTAVDVVDSLIKYNKNKFKNLNVNFQTLNITNQTIPFTDVIILKQVLQHLSNQDIFNILKNIYLKSKYIILTESIPYDSFTPNLDIKSGVKTRVAENNSGVDILSLPFNFPIQEKFITLTLEEMIESGEDKLKYLTQTIIYKQYE